MAASAHVSTAGSTYNAAMNPVRITASIKLKREKERKSFFSMLRTNMQEDGNLSNKQDTRLGNLNGVVMSLEQTIPMGGDTVNVPMLMRLRNEPHYGDKEIDGEEEKQVLRYHQSKVNEIRHAVKSEGRMSDFRARPYRYYDMARPQLSDYFATEEDVESIRALTVGWSKNLYSSADKGGLNVNSGTLVSHQNLFVAGIDSNSGADSNGLVTWSSTASTYESNVATAIDYQNDNLADSVAGSFQLSLLDDIEGRLETDFEIEALPNGKYIVLLHPNQWRQARTSGGDLFDLLKAAGERGDGNPLFSGLRGMYEYNGKWIIAVHQRVPAVYTDGTTLYYEYAYTRNPGIFSSTLGAVSNSHTKQRMGFILGNGALARGMAEGLQFNEDDKDYKKFKGVAAHEVIGLTRTLWQSDANPAPSVLTGEPAQKHRHTGSVAFVTYSPTPTFGQAA